MESKLLNQRLQQLKTLSSAGLDSIPSAPASGVSLESSTPILVSRPALPSWALTAALAVAAAAAFYIIKAKK